MEVYRALCSLVQSGSWLGHRFLERIEIDGHQVEGAEAMLVQLGQVGGHVAAGQDASMDGRVQRLDPTPQDLGKTGQLARRSHRHAGRLQGPLGPTRRIELCSQFDQAPAQGFEAGLVGHTDERAHIIALLLSRARFRGEGPAGWRHPMPGPAP